MRTPLLAAAAVLAAAFVVPDATATPGRRGDAVVALVDTGINPYHATFRDRSARALRHPSTYLPGFPKDAVALPVTLGAKDYWSAVRADCARIWSRVRPGRLYWFPGTKIVGAVSFDLSLPGADCSGSQPAGMPVLDEHGHGTMTASRAAGARYGACPHCRVVSVQFQTAYGVNNASDAEASAVGSLAWVAGNAGWIDALSNSWSPLPVWDPTGTSGLFATSPALARAAERASRATTAFWSAGNGIARIGGVLGHPTVGTPHHTPSGIVVGGVDSGQVETWSGSTPDVVSDACASWAAEHRTVTGEGDSVGGGTSAAAPYVAGSAAAQLAHARAVLGDRRTGVRRGAVARGRAAGVRTGPLADGTLTASEWRDVVLRTATARPAAQPEDGPPCSHPARLALPVRWADVPPDAPAYPLIGYGAVDRPAVTLARRVLSGSAPLPAREEVAAYFAARAAAQSAAHTVYTTP